MKRYIVSVVIMLTGCIQAAPAPVYVPSMRYSRGDSVAPSIYAEPASRQADSRASYGGAAGNSNAPKLLPVSADSRYVPVADDLGPNVNVVPSREQVGPEYRGPLALGEPGISASLWRENRGVNDIFRDERAWRPMDILTIVVTERSRGLQNADTESKTETTIDAAITALLGLETKADDQDPPLNPSSLVSASTDNEFKGNARTQRQAELTARISAVVVEVLPSNLLRIEGEKIITVNKEEQSMVISGLVRPRDINSLNEIDSSKVAQLRIDYTGKGEVGDAQSIGWLGRIFRIVWPF